MTAFDFPSSPTVGQVYQAYTWDGEKWYSTLGGIALVPPYATWDAATVEDVTLSGGNLIATNTATDDSQGVHVAASAALSAGKYYFEYTFTTLVGGSSNQSVGIGLTTATYNALGNNGAGGAIQRASGFYRANSFLGANLGSCSNGTVIGVAVDIGNRQVWFRKPPSGNWNADSGANPATNTGGAGIPGSGAFMPWCTFGFVGSSGNVVTANFGATAFVGAVPSGFTAGWPA